MLPLDCDQLRFERRRSMGSCQSHNLDVCMVESLLSYTPHPAVSVTGSMREMTRGVSSRKVIREL